MKAKSKAKKASGHAGRSTHKTRRTSRHRPSKAADVMYAPDAESATNGSEIV